MTQLTGIPNSGIWAYPGVGIGTALEDQANPSGGSFITGMMSGIANLSKTLLPSSGSTSTPAYASGYNVTGGVITSPSQVSTAQIDGQTSWADQLKNGLGSILQTMGAAAAAQSENSGGMVRPASYQTGGNGGLDPVMVILLVGGAGLAIYAASK